MFKNVSILVSRTKDPNNEITGKLILNIENILNSSDIKTCFVEDNPTIDDIKDADIVFCVGGDGTMLSAAHLCDMYNKHIVGINLGRKGFLCQIDKDNITEYLYALRDQKYKVVRYPFIQGIVYNKHYWGINDVLISKTNPLSTVHLKLKVSGEHIQDYICDGLLVSTSLGSTAYNRALNNTIIHPDCEVLSITPIGAADKLFDNLIVPRETIIEVEVLRGDSIVGFDGMQESLMLHPGETIRIQRAFTYINLILFDNKSYYRNLKSKILE